MNNMNPIYQEFTVRRQTKEIEAELRQNRLAKEAAQATVHNGWAAHRIAHFAEWMITTGESLSQRYDHKSMHSYKTRTGALAH